MDIFAYVLEMVYYLTEILKNLSIMFWW